MDGDTEMATVDAVRRYVAGSILKGIVTFVFDQIGTCLAPREGRQTGIIDLPFDDIHLLY